jgi:hypothetical protein
MMFAVIRQVTNTEAMTTNQMDTFKVSSLSFPDYAGR